MGAIFAATDSVATLQVLDKDAMPHLFALVFGEGVVNDAVSVVLLGAVATAAKAHTSGGGGGGGAQHRLAGGVVLNFVWLLVTSLLLGGAAGLGVATALKHLQLKEAHQVCVHVCVCVVCVCVV
jgi:NhaP-type Na+/H+ or K+/H+ antiporter